ncbi:MAG: GFA family protein [Myxococcales bacterium]|nr:GFA family protein [Myxococcales bacterium]
MVLCHCKSCRRGAGAPAVAWALVASDDLAFTKGEPERFDSSSGVERGFCRRCGTPLTFRADYMAGLVDVTIGSLDDPDRLPPVMHIWDSRRVAWFESADAWPRHAEFPPR